jgi:hypothetical protein
MPDAFAESTARLERLVAQVMKEKEPEKCHELAAEKGGFQGARPRQKRVGQKRVD